MSVLQLPREKRKVLYLLIIVIFVLTFLFFLVFSKKISVNRIFINHYSMKGVDVSNYQGDIDWMKLEQQGVDFAFIKATEGSSYEDKRFRDNWEKISDTNIYAGAYHFFSFESSGERQAENFIHSVGELDGKMLPAVDVEYYGKKTRKKLKIDKVRTELRVLLSRLEEKYGKKPIIYCTYKSYHDLIQNEFEEYDLWIRNVYFTPNVNLSGRWKYWQYTDRAKLNGYSGNEKYIDMNVFNGNKDEFLKYNKLGEWKSK